MIGFEPMRSGIIRAYFLKPLRVLATELHLSIAKLIIIALLFSACSPSWHLKKAERHLKKAEVKGAQVRVDTVWKSIEVIVPEVRVDTVLKQVNFRDTIEFWQDRFHVRVKVDTLTKSVYIEGKCESDTVRLEVPVTVTKEIKSGWPWWWLIVAALAGAGVVSFIRQR